MKALLLLLLVHMTDRPDLDSWFSGLRSPAGLCCSFADAEMLTDVQWDTQDGHYRVFLDNHWINVRREAVIESPNRYGPAIVWPLRYPQSNGKVYDIRCFIPGEGT